MTPNLTVQTAQAAGRRRGGVSSSALPSISGQMPVETFCGDDSAGGSDIEKSPRGALSYTHKCWQAFYSIKDLAARWRCSRATVYGLLRGERVVDFAPAPGRKGHKLVPAETVERIERERMRVMR